MKKLALALALLFGQGTQQSIPVPIQSQFQLGYGSTFTQPLAITPKTVQAPIPGVPGYPYVADGVYVLKFSVTNYFSVYPGYYTAEIDFGTQELCEASGWGTQNWNEITVTCPSPGYIIIDRSLSDTDQSGPLQSNQPFTVTFTGGGWPLLFDGVGPEHKISFTFTPN